MHDPSFSQRRPSFGCFYGTFIPSCRHILSTRFTFMAHPASRSDPAIAVVAVLAGDGDDVRGQCILVGASAWRLPLRRATLAHNATGKAFGDPEFPSDVINACSAAGGAQKFPEAASRRMSFSSVRSETAFRSLLLSFSSSFKRFARSVFNPHSPLSLVAAFGVPTDAGLNLIRTPFGSRSTIRRR